MAAMADHIRQRAERVILSLPTRLCLNDDTVLNPRLLFAQNILLANRSNATTDEHYASFFISIGLSRVQCPRTGSVKIFVNSQDSSIVSKLQF
jgi:hypothetical protein